MIKQLKKLFQKQYKFDTNTWNYPAAIDLFNKNKSNLETLHQSKVKVTSVRENMNHDVIIYYKLDDEVTNDKK